MVASSATAKLLAGARRVAAPTAALQADLPGLTGSLTSASPGLLSQGAASSQQPCRHLAAVLAADSAPGRLMLHPARHAISSRYTQLPAVAAVSLAAGVPPGPAWTRQRLVSSCCSSFSLGRSHLDAVRDPLPASVSATSSASALQEAASHRLLSCSCKQGPLSLAQKHCRGASGRAQPGCLVSHTSARSVTCCQPPQGSTMGSTAFGCSTGPLQLCGLVSISGHSSLPRLSPHGRRHSSEAFGLAGQPQHGTGADKAFYSLPGQQYRRPSRAYRAPSNSRPGIWGLGGQQTARWQHTMLPGPPAELSGSFLEGLLGAAGLAGCRKQVMVALSGGVDSAVAAHLAQQAGHDVTGVFVKTWDSLEERGHCTADEDLASAKQVAAHLGIQLLEADFTAEYWRDVFADLIEGYEQGLTPNPDLACNRHIKFGSLLAWARAKGADALVTGHYARIQRTEQGQVHLLRGVDPDKDQSYFLASVPQQALKAVHFPLGALTKAQVRQVAAQLRVPSAARRSSAGICFIGRRKFQDFLAQYCVPVQGSFRDVASGQLLGPCANITALTHGQRAGLGGAPSRMYVVGKDMAAREVWVVGDEHHPALFTQAAVLHPPLWLEGEAPWQLLQQGQLHCSFMARYRQPLARCSVRAASGALPGNAHRPAWQVHHAEQSRLQPSKFCRLSSGDESSADSLQVEFEEPQRAITPQQAFVMYQGEACLGSAAICYPGPSVWELNA